MSLLNEVQKFIEAHPGCTMPQASSIVYIALIGGAGYNVGSPHQAGISELVLRAGNGNPKGITRNLQPLIRQA
ncbi:hypothetical protein IGC89_002956 [Escherichia coli]|nr:hypothetical protein [Escherichia coli]EFM4251309.1 hypothetical protein [Escherichia coli]EGI3123788.1 hypothetical protein [Escherichia coli]EGI3128518.1 hypothetical protein [Escherichia coli]EGI3142908.1 hypothetical protein [Escherichia coli]